MTYLWLDIASRLIQIDETVDRSLGCQQGEKLFLSGVEALKWFLKRAEKPCKWWLLFLVIRINIF